MLIFDIWISTSQLYDIHRFRKTFTNISHSIVVDKQLLFIQNAKLFNSHDKERAPLQPLTLLYTMFIIWNENSLFNSRCIFRNWLVIPSTFFECFVSFMLSRIIIQKLSGTVDYCSSFSPVLFYPCGFFFWWERAFMSVFKVFTKNINWCVNFNVYMLDIVEALVIICLILPRSIYLFVITPALIF